MSMNWYAQFSMYQDSYELFAAIDRGDRREIITTELTATVVENTSVAFEEPTLRLQRGDAQSLMNALWMSGLRPNDGNASVAHTEAMQKHLSDLRDIAFHALKMDKKP